MSDITTVEPQAEVLQFKTKSIEATPVQEQAPASGPQPGQAVDPIERDIRDKHAAKFVTDEILKAIDDIKPILSNIDRTNPAVFRNNVAEALKGFAKVLGAISAGFQIEERENSEILVKLHRAYIAWVAETDKRIRIDQGHVNNRATLTLERLASQDRARIQEILRLEHSLQTLFYALAEQGIFTDSEPDEWTPEAIQEREASYLAGIDAYRKKSKRILHERLGLDSKRGPYGEIRLTGGCNIELFNVEGTDIDNYVAAKPEEE